MTIIYGLIVLGIIIFIHEAGHCLCSIACGVKVEAFSIGMGPILLHKKIKGIDWRLSVFPFGGYCAMKGEKDFQDACENGTNIENADKDSLYGTSPVFRALIAFSGPAANLLLAFFCFFTIALTGYSYYASSNQIRTANEVYEGMKSVAAEAGIKSGDKIIAIDGNEMSDFSQIASYIAAKPKEKINIKIERNGEILDFTVLTELDKSSGAGKIGIVNIPESTVKKEAQRYGFFQAIKQAFFETGKLIFLTLKGITLLFRGVDLTNAVSGPARITTMLGETVKSGFQAGFRTGLSSVLNFTALISISLFIMNLLPIPVLDGSLILFSLIETIFSISIPPKIRMKAQFAGLAVIAILFVIAITGDIKYFIGLLNEK